MLNSKIAKIDESKKSAVLENGKNVELADNSFKIGEKVVVRDDGKAYHRLED